MSLIKEYFTTLYLTMYNVYIMIQITAYLRTEEDLAKWKALKNKTEWLHNHLASGGTIDALSGKSVQDPSPVEQEILDSLPRNLPITTANKLKTNGTCKKCGTPLTSFGKCLQKGH